MKLYTLNATPIRNYKQLTSELQSDIKRKRDTLKAINAREVEFYPETVADILKKHGVDGFTIYQVQGYWMGESETSFKIEIATDGGVGMIASDLRDAFNQDAVMVTHPDNTVEFI